MNSTGPVNISDWPAYGEFPAVEYSSGRFEPIRANLSMEYSITLSINGSPYIIIACSGSDLREMAVGHLISEGIVVSPGEIRDVVFNPAVPEINVVTDMNERILDSLMRLRRMPSGCGQGAGAIDAGIVARKTPVKIDASTVLSSMKEFLNYSKIHKLTRGVHGAALYSAKGEMIVFFEEIGRHNAVDKVLGHALLGGIDLADKLVLTTGRISSEIIIKLLHTASSTIISRASPTSLSCELAARYGMTMIGRVRAGGFCVFNGFEHVAP